MSVRIVVDANILLSAVIGKTTARYFDRLLNCSAEKSQRCLLISQRNLIQIQRLDY